MLRVSSPRSRRLAALALALTALAAPLPASGQAPPSPPPPPAPGPPPLPPPPGPPLPPPGFGQAPLPPPLQPAPSQAPLPLQPLPGYGQAPPFQPLPRYGQDPSLPPPDEPRGQIDGGFVLEANVGGRVSLASLTTGSSNVSAALGANGLSVGLLVGFKTGRLILGLNLGFFNLTESAGSSSISESALLLGPEMQVVLARSNDQRVELLGDVGIDFGHVFASSSGFEGDSIDPNLYITYQLGLGVRYWLHPQFAVQGLTGFGGEALIDLSSDSESSGTASAHGIFTSLGLVGVF
jgi:hypothetical protein